MRISRLATALTLALALFAGASCQSPSGGSASGGVTLPEVQPDKGLVIFYRMKKAKGSAIRFQISHGDGQPLRGLSNGTFFHEDVEPGSKTYQVRSPSLDGQHSVTLDVVAGETYYIRGEILWGWPAGRPKFVRVNPSRAQSELTRF